MIKFSTFRVLILIIIFSVEMNAGLAQKQSNTEQSYPEWNKFSFEFGGYLANINSNFRLGFDNLGIGLDINFEEALGLETTTFTFFGDFLYRFSKNRKHAFGAQYFQIVRKANKFIEAEFEINDQVFSKGTELGSSFSMVVINADYSYSFLMDDRVNISGSFGFFIMPIKFSFSRDDKKSEQTKFVAPLPAIGLESYFRLSKKFTLRQGLHLFYLKMNTLKGSMTDLSIMLEYNPIHHLTFGTGFNSFAIDISQGKSSAALFGDLVGNVGYKHSGLMFYGVYAF